MVKKHRSTEEWLDIMKRSEQSGIPILAWCQQNGVNYKSLNNAQRRLAKQMKKSARALKKAEGKFTKFVPAGTQENGHIRIELKNGNSIHLSNDNREGLKTVLEVIGAAA